MNCSRAALPASSPEMGCPMFAQFFRANVGPRAILREFPCSPRRCLPAVAGPSAAEPAEEGGTPLCPSHKAARNPVLSLLFSINYNGTYNLLKTGTIKTFVFTLMRTLSPQVPCYEQTNKNIPGVWVPPPCGYIVQTVRIPGRLDRKHSRHCCLAPTRAATFTSGKTEFVIA